MAKIDDQDRQFSGDLVEQTYPQNYPLVPGYVWLVATDETSSYDVAKALGLVSGGNEDASGVVVPAKGVLGLCSQGSMAAASTRRVNGRCRHKGAALAARATRMNPPAAVAIVNEKTDKEEPGASFVAGTGDAEGRRHPNYRAREARSVDQQHLMASAALSLRYLFLRHAGQRVAGRYCLGLAHGCDPDCRSDRILVVRRLAALDSAQPP